MEFLKKVKSTLASCRETVSHGWHAMWSFLEDKAGYIRQTYDIRDFKSCSQYSIWFAILSIVFGFFNLSINTESLRISVGFNTFAHVGMVFILIGFICLIAGTLTTTDAGLLFILAAMTLPFVGEFVHFFVDTVTGNFVSYIVTNWLFLVTYTVIAACYVLMTLRILPVKYARWIVFGICAAASIYSILSAVLLLPPFYGDKSEAYKTESGVYPFVFISDIVRMIAMMLSLSTATMTVFPFGEGPKEKSKVVLKEEKEEF